MAGFEVRLTRARAIALGVVVIAGVVIAGVVIGVSSRGAASRGAAPVDAASVDAAPVDAASSGAAPSGAAPVDAASSGAASPGAAPSDAAPVGAAAPVAVTLCNGNTKPCAIGDIGPGGGIVFYDEGEVRWWGRYLEAAPAGWAGGEDPAAEWCSKNDSVRTGLGIGEGKLNTPRIVEMCGGDSAAGVAAGYRGGGKDDWFLPSKYELNALYEQRNVVGGLCRCLFWSSSQSDYHYSRAWTQSFDDGSLGNGSYKDGARRVRPVRAFY